MKRYDFLRLLGAAGATFCASPFRALAEPLIQPTVAPALPPTQDPDTVVPLEYQDNAHFVHSGSGFGRRVALTFDDGPNPGITEVVLAELAKRNLKATFFMIGNNARLYPDLVRAVHQAGHEVANHSYTHPQLNRMSDDKVREQLEKTQEAIYSACGTKPVWFRPPYGAFRTNQGPIPRSMDLGVAYWSVDPLDWSQPGVAKIISRILTASRPGSIILMHDLHKQTALAVPEIFDGILERDLVPTRMSDLLGSPYQTGEYI